jgi:hypothetical protein
VVLASNSIYLVEKYTGQTDTFVELKTSLAIRGPHDEAKFEKYVNASTFGETFIHVLQETPEVLLPIISAGSTGMP